MLTPSRIRVLAQEPGRRFYVLFQVNPGASVETQDSRKR